MGIRFLGRNHLLWIGALCHCVIAYPIFLDCYETRVLIGGIKNYVPRTKA